MLSTVYGVIYDFFRYFKPFLCNNVYDLDVPMSWGSFGILMHATFQIFKRYKLSLAVALFVIFTITVAVFATDEERTIHIFPTNVASDGWMKEGLALEQNLGAQAIFDDFNRTNSTFVIVTPEGILDTGLPETGDVEITEGNADDTQEDGTEETETVSDDAPLNESEEDQVENSEEEILPLPDISVGRYLLNVSRGFVGYTARAQDTGESTTEVGSQDESVEEPVLEESVEVSGEAEEGTEPVEGVEEVDSTENGEVSEGATSENQNTEGNTDDIIQAEEDVRVCQVLGIECHTIQFTGFDIGSVLSDFTVKGYELRISLAAQTLGESFTPDKLLVRYQYRGAWYVAGEILLDKTLSNYDNGGHFAFQLPNVQSWDALNDFRVELEYVRQGEVRTELFVDSVWIDTTYEAESVDQTLPEVSNILHELAVLEDSGRPDVLIENEKRIELTATEYVPGDELVLRSDFDVYNGLTTARAYIAVTNMSNREENFRLITRTGHQAQVMRLEERIKNVPTPNDTPVYSEVAYFCEAGWDLELSQNSADIENFQDKNISETEETFEPVEEVISSTEPEALVEGEHGEEPEGGDEMLVEEETGTLETEVLTPDPNEETEVVEDTSEVELTSTYTCRATGQTETCNSFNADKTNCIVGNDRINISETMVYENGWEPIPLLEVTDGGRSATSFFDRLFGNDEEENTPTLLTSIQEADRDFRIMPRETRYFAIDLEFEVQRAGEFVVEVEGDEADATRSMWWRSAFGYRMPVTFEAGESLDGDVPGLYEVRIDRTHSEFFERAALDGADVRFYDPATRKEVPSRPGDYSYVDQLATYMVELEREAFATRTLFAYFGNEQVTSASRLLAPQLTPEPIAYAGITKPSDGAVLSLVSEYENARVQSRDNEPITLVRGVSQALLVEGGEETLSSQGPLQVRLSGEELTAGVRDLLLSYPPDMHVEEVRYPEGGIEYRLARYKEVVVPTTLGAVEELPLPAVGVFESLLSKNLFDHINYLRNLQVPQLHDFREALKDFAIGEDITFSLKYRPQKGKFSRFWSGLFRDRLAQVTEVHLMRDGALVEDAHFEIVYGVEGEWTIHILEMPRELVPGKYTLALTVDETGTAYSDSFDFYWGVLVINTPQSVYKMDDLTKFHMAALDDKGDTICDAELRLTLTTPEGDAEEIRVEPQPTCGANNVTDDPDYLAWYRPHEVGKYGITLTHVNLDGEVVHQITDSFEVAESQSYIIERHGATRIWPKASYVMELAVTATADFVGEVVEAIPIDFELIDTGDAETTMWGRAKRLVWNVELQAGETQVFRYEYDAPDVSPYVYLLGPAEIRIGGQTAFIESRTWKLASDALGQYVEQFISITPSTTGAWTTIDLSGAPYNIPANAVIEMALINTDYGNELYAGVRHASSTLDRRFLLHEAETTGTGVEGMSEVTVHVTASASSSIQYYADSATLVTFRILGYWTDGVYVERFDTTDPSTTDDAWVNWDLNTYGLTQGDVAEIVMVNNQANTDFLAGVRTDGSALNRYIRLHEPETGGDTYATMFVQATTSTARVETYSDDDGPGIGTDVDFILSGYWDTMPTGLTYKESWSDLGGPTANTTWTDRRLDNLTVPPTGIAEVVFANNADANGAIELGVRTNGSSLGRVLDLHEAEGGSTGVTPSRMMVTAGSDASSTIEYYTESTAADNFYLAGYWSASNYPADEPILYNVPFDNEKTGSSTPYFEFSALDPDGATDIIYEIQWDDDADVATSPLGDRTSDNEAGCSPNCFTNTVSGGDTSPFTEGNRIRFTMQSALTTGTTYYWRVRAKDIGSGIYGEWSDILSFTYVENTSPKAWIQTEDTQFDQGTLSGTETYGANKVRLATTPPVGAMVAYGSNTNTSPHYRIWNGTAWSASSSALSVGGQISWTTLRAATTRNEYILATQDTGGDVNVQIYNGTTGTWGNLWEVTPTVGSPAYKAFDVQYQTQSGNAVVAYCDGNQDPSYAVWNGTAWSATSTIDLTFTQNCEWLAMAADPSSDELIMVARANVAQANPDYEAQVYDPVAGSWGSSYTGGAGDEAAREGIAIGYEESGTNAVIVISNGQNGNFAYNSWDGSSWGTGGTVGLGDDFEWGQVASDNGTDDMALCYIDEDDDMGTVFWNGTTNTWGAYREHDTEGDVGVADADAHGRPISCQYETTAGRDGYHLVAYSNTVNAEYNYFTGSVWQYLVNSGASISSVEDSWTVNTTRTGDGKILAVFHDNTNTRYDFSAWDGSSWTTKTTIDDYPSRTAEPWYEPISIAAQQYQASVGSIVSTIVDFDLVIGQPSWGEVIWNTTEPVGTNATLQVYYATTTAACNVLVPDAVLSGNSTGFDATASPLNLSGLSTSTYNMLCIKTNLTSTVAQTPTLDDWSLSWERQPYLSENKYRWYTNVDSLSPSDVWPVGSDAVDESTPIPATFAPSFGSVLRLRLSILDTNVSLSASSIEVKLQWAEGVTCSSDMVWTDVGDIGSSEPWRGYHNNGVSDGTTLSSTLLSTSDTVESYEESNPAVSNPNGITTGNEGEWDFVLEHNATSSTNYCFRAIHTDGTELSAYNTYPQLITNAPPTKPLHEAPFDNQALASTTPWFEFVAEDVKLDDLHYQIQVDDDITFGSTIIDMNSSDDFTAFTNLTTPSDKSPFNAGENVRLVPTTALSNGTTYWWRVRARDPSGSGEWGEWSDSTSLTISSVTETTWFQTTLNQFDTDTHEQTEATSTDSIVLTPPNTTGTTTSSAIDYEWGTQGNAWGSLSWSDTETASDLKYKLEYNNAGTWELIPDGALAGNSAGFDNSSVSLLGLDPTVYNELRIVAVFTNAGASPSLQSWTLSWGYAVEQPTLLTLFDNEKVGTTTPSFTFYSTDPETNDLVYEISWSTDATFLTGSTTRSSDTHAGFTNTSSTTDTTPFFDGDTIRFVIQSGDAVTNGSTYWWRVRARDPGGADVWSVWSPQRSFTVDTAVTSSTWHQTTDEQLDTDTLNSTEASGVDTARITSVVRDVLLVYAEGVLQTPRYRMWNGTSWGTEKSASNIGERMYWARTAPASTRDEYVLVTGGVSGAVKAQVYTAVTQTWSAPVSLATLASAVRRGFDVAYETDSGDALAVSCWGSEATYSVWNGVSWSATTTINLASTQNCEWIELASDPESDEIIMTARANPAEATYDFEAQVWNGSGWGNSTRQGAMEAADVENIGMDIAYEGSGGDAVFVTSNNTNANFHSRTWNGSSWSATSSVALADDLETPKIVQDVGSDNLAMCYVANNNGLYFTRWTGSAWGAVTQISIDSNSKDGGHSFDCTYETTSGRDGYLLFPYTDTITGFYRYWDTATLQPETALSTFTDSWAVQTVRAGDGVVLVASWDDANTNIDVSHWNGSVWATRQTLETNVSALATANVPMHMSARKYPSVTSGSVISSPINFYDGEGPRWDLLSWNDTTPGTSDILYQIEYSTDSGDSWTLVPDGVLAGNSAGFTTGPVAMENMPYTTYNLIRVNASFACSAGDCPTLSDWTVTWSEGVTVSGTAKQYDQTTNVTSGTVAVAVNGVLQSGKTGTIGGGGTWSIANVTAFPGDTIMVFIDGASDASEAAAVTAYDGVGNVTNIPLYERHLTLGSDDATTTTNALIGLYDYSVSGDEDVFFDVDIGNDLYVCASASGTCGDVELIVRSNFAYRPDSSNSGTLYAHDVEINGTITPDNNTLYVSGSWDNNGTFTAGGSTVIFTATSTNELVDATGASASSFNTVTFGQTSGTALFTLGGIFDVEASVSVAYGTLYASSASLYIGGNLSLSNGTTFLKGIGTTTFDGSVVGVITDSTVSKQDLGKVHINGSSKIVRLGAPAKLTYLTIEIGNTFDVSATNYALEVVGDFVNRGNFSSRSGTVTFSATTTGHVIDSGTSAWYNITANGVGGNWAFVPSQVTIGGNLTVATGTLTLTVGTTTVSGNITNSGGVFVHNNGTVELIGSGAKTLYQNNSPFFNVTVNGTGSWSWTDQNATSSGSMRLQNGTLTYPAETLTIGKSLVTTGGTINANGGTLRFTSPTIETISTNGSALFNVIVSGEGGSFAFTDTNLTASGTVRFLAGTSTLPTGVFTVGGSFETTGGTWNSNGGTVLFNSTATGRTVSTGQNTFAHVTFNSATGGWTIQTNATSTGNWSITNASSFTVESGNSVAVGGTFGNSVPSATTWSGSILHLYSGTAYTIGSKTQSPESYGTFIVGSNTDVRMWQSSSTAYSVHGTGSLYSQDHAGVDGDLYIWGEYVRTSGSDYWNYITDFDGTDITSTPRQVAVRFASGASVQMTGASLQMIGNSVATTTLANQGSGSYALSVSSSTVNAQYYRITNTDINGFQILGSSTVQSLSDGEYVLTYNTGSMLTLSSTTINANPALQPERNSFSTTSGVTSGYNVYASGTPISYWWFKTTTGNYDGESYDNDPTGDPGNVRWDDSGFTIAISGVVYAGEASGGPSSACDGSSPRVKLVVSGVTQYTTSCDPGDGSFLFPAVTFSGDVSLIAYIDGAGVRGATVSRTPQSSITDFDIYQSYVIVRHEDTIPLTIAQMLAYDGDADGDIPFDAESGILTVSPETALFVMAGKEFAPGGDIALQSGGSGAQYDGTLRLDDNSTLRAVASENYSIGGSWLADTGSTFVSASGTVTFTATTSGKTITALSDFYNLTMNGSGGVWTVSSPSTITNDVQVNAGTLAGATNITIQGGDFSGDGTVNMTGGTVTLSGTGFFGGASNWTFNNLTLGAGGNGVTTKSGIGNTTLSGVLTVATNHELEAGSANWTLTGSGAVFAVTGLFSADTSTTTFAGTAAMTVPALSYHNLVLAPNSGGSPSYTLLSGNLTASTLSVGNGTHAVTINANTQDPLITVSGNVTIRANATFSAASANDLLLGGSYVNQGTFTSNSGGVVFNSVDSGEVVTPGNSSFHHLTFNDVGGGWTILGNATTTGNFTLTNASSFTQTSGTTLAVQGIFTNSVGGASTEWSGTTLYLNSGTSYSLNTKTNGGDSYGTLRIGANTDTKMWNSQATTVTVDGSGSLYSQDHAEVDGDLYIWGDYVRASGDDYWSYTTDFDGTDITGSPREVAVRLAANATTTLSGGSLSIVGGSGATTTIANQGSGTYALRITGGTFNAEYYQMRNLISSGLTFSGTPIVSELSNGDYLLGSNGGSMISVASSVIDANPVKLFSNIVFATSSGIGSGYNVTATGVSVSSWRFLPGTGNYYGEAYDSDPGGNPGYIIFSDSDDEVTISGNVYSDEGTTVSSVCNGSSQVVALVIDGGTPVTTSCLAGTGHYEFTGVSGYVPGDTITVFLDGVSPKAANVTRDLITSISDMHLYENRVILRHEETNPMSIASLAVYDSGDDADIPFTATTGSPDSLWVSANIKLIVWNAKTFKPNGNVTLLSGGTGTTYDGTLELQTNASYLASTTASETILVGGSWLTGTGATFTAGLSTVTFIATTSGKTISPDRSSFYNLTFNGIGGVWTFADRDATTTNDVLISAGNVTFGTSTLTVGGSFVNNATMSTASTTITFSSAQPENVTFGGYSVGSLRFSGTGLHTMTDTNATSTGLVSITAGSVSLPTGVFAVAESFSAEGGTFIHAGTLRLYGTLATQTLRLGTSLLRNLTIAGTGSWVFADTNATTTGTTTIQAGGLTAPSGMFSIGGSFINNASFNSNAGHVYFFATTTGQQIFASSSVFANVTLSGAGGGWTVTGSATTTGAWRLQQGASFTMASSTKLEVQGIFENTIGGVATNWTDSVLYLNASGTSYTINTKTAGGDSYAFFTLGANTDVRMWDSAGSTTTVPSTSSLYSMDNNAASGDLYIWGEYVRSSGNDYWSYATDFDGTALGGSSRQVDVRIASSSVLSFSGGGLEIIGTAPATTTIAVLGVTGAFAFAKSGGSLNAQYYSFRNLDASGMVLSNTIAVTSLSYGDFERGTSGGTLLQVSSQTIDQNPTKIILGTRFGTTSGVSGVTNVQRNGDTSNFWDFQGHMGEIDGEAYDSDGADACGAIRWDDSTCLEVSQSHYRFRSDNGGGGAPNSEWYDADWSKRVRVNVTNSNATPLTNGAVRIAMPYDSDMQNDWTDLRFTDSSGTTSIPYFVESYTTSATATVWVKIPSIPANGSTHVFAYYGNAVATNGENGAATFTMFDDFEDDNISEYSGDTGYFDVVANAGAEGSYVLEAGAGYEANFTIDGIYRTGTTFGQGSTIRFMQYVDASEDDEPCTLFGVQTPGSNNQNYAVCLDQYPSDKLILAKDVESNDASGSVLASSTVSWSSAWYTVEVDWYTNNLIYVSVYNSAGTLFATTSVTDASYTSGGMGFSFWGQNGAWDFYTARPYTANEPVATVGLEQGADGASWKADLDTAYSQAQEEVFRVRFSIENSGPQITGQQWRLQYADRTGYGTCAAVPSVDFDDVPNQAGCGISPICTVSTSEYSDGETTQQLLTSETYLPFTMGYLIESPSNQTTGMTLDQGHMTEVEYAVELTPYATADSYCMRTSNGGLELDSYQQVAEVTAKYGPVITDWSLNEEHSIALVEGETTAIVATGTVSDLNGWEDILYASSTVYRSGLGATCTANDNNCYQLSSLECPLTDCAGTSCTITCTANIQYFAEPTDAGSDFEGQHWEAEVFVVDTTNNEATTTSMGVDLNTLWGLSMVTGDIEYGSLGLAEDTGNKNATSTLENTGNDDVDIDIEGTDMTGGVASAIPVANQKFSTSTFTYSSCVICSALSGTANTFEVDLPKPTSTTPVTDDLYWGLYVPSGTEGVVHFGRNTFYAIGD